MSYSIETDILTLLDSPIAFHRVFVDVCGSVTAALLLSQILYWSKRTKDPDGWFWKTQDDWKEETGLSRYEQEGARAVLRKLKILEEKKEAQPPSWRHTLYFRLNKVRLVELLNLCSSSNCWFSTSKDAENQHPNMRKTSIQESGKTTFLYKESETTTETTTEREVVPLSAENSSAISITTSSEFQRNRYHDWVKSHWDSLQEEYLPFFQGSVVLLRRSLANCIAWSFDNADRAKKFSNPGMRIRKWLDEEDVDRLIRAQEGQEKAAARVANANPSFAWKNPLESLPDKNSDFPSLVSEYKRLFSIFVVFAKDNLNFHITNSDWIRFENDMLNNKQKYLDYGDPGFPAFYDFFGIRS